MELYFLKSAVCLTILFLFYKLLLEKENMHVFKRYYLLAAVIISVLIPFVTFKEYVEVLPANSFSEISFYKSNISSEETTHWLPNLIWGIYLLGVILFGSIFIRNFSEIIRKIRKNSKIRSRESVDVLLQENLPPHSFWTFIFLNKDKYKSGQIPEAVYQHEQVHVVQRHSLDVLLVEFLQILFWFFPLIYILKKAVKLNHEFLADQAVLEEGMDKVSYQKILLAYSSNSLHSNLVNPINYSSIKKRFTVMRTKTSKTGILLRVFLLLPLLTFLLYSFSSRTILERPIENTLLLQEQETVTPQMIAEYNEWARNMNNKEHENLVVLDHVLNRMKSIYKRMSSEQKEEAEPFPSLEKEIIVVKEDPNRATSTREKARNAERESRKAEQNQVRREEIEIRRERAEIRREKAERRREKAQNAERESRRAEQNQVRREEIEIRRERAEVRREKAERQREKARKHEEKRRGMDIPAPPIPPTPSVADHPVPPIPPKPENSEIQAPPPPPPPTPIEAVEKWIAEDAEFFYNGKKVSGEKALEVVQKHNGKNLSVQIQENNSRKIIRISDKKE